MAAHDYVELFSGSNSRAATIAAMRLDRFVELVIAFLEGVAKRR